MKRLFYPRLAFSNIKKNAKTYVPYILTCIFTVSLFYIMHSISTNEGLFNTFGGDSLLQILSLGVGVVAIFSCIFLFYTNSFLIKRRKKEIGLYNILGMEKRHIMAMLFFEMLYVTIISLVIGLLTGVVFSKLMFLILLNIIHLQTALVFSISIPSMRLTVLLFVGIYLATLFFNIFQIHIVNPIELLKGGNSGEKEPKTKWLLTIVGVICLLAGYGIAQTIESPMDALLMFFVAVILVILGTYALFVAGSIAILKALKRRKSFYYKTKHFTAVSGMIYRMKQNAVGLANICILSTCVIVMLSTTISLYVGQEDVLNTRFRYNVIIKTTDIIGNDTNYTDASNITKIRDIYQEEVVKHNAKPKDMIDYQSIVFSSTKINNDFTTSSQYSNSVDSLNSIQLITVDQYNQTNSDNITLKDDEILYYQPDATNKAPKEITLNGQTFHVKKQLEDAHILLESLGVIKNYCFIVNSNEVLNTILQSDIYATKQHILAFNMDNNDTKDMEFIKSLQEKVNQVSSTTRLESKELARGDFFSLYGGMFFLGIFLGTEFLMAAALIIYYKQVSEGYDDKQRYEIMQKVGMSKKEVKSSINSQVVLVFFLPLIVAVIHFGFAFKMITKLLALLNLTNITLFLICSACTIGIFAIIYALVYYITSKVYYRIVK